MEAAVNNIPATATKTEISPILLGLLVGTLVAVAAAYSGNVALVQRSALSRLTDWFLYVDVASFGAAFAVVLVADRLSRWSRLVAMAALLLLAAVLLAILPWASDHGRSPQHLPALVTLAAVQGAEFVAAAFGVGLAFESRANGTRMAVIFGCATSFASCVVFVANLLATKVNPDFGSRDIFAALDGAAAALAAVAALGWIVLQRRSLARAKLPSRAGLTIAARQMWSKPPLRIMAGAYLIQLCLTIGISGLGYVLASSRGDVVKAFGVMAWLSPAANVIAFWVGAIFADSCRRGGRNPAGIAVWAAGAALLLYLFALNVDDAFQSIIFLTIAGAVGAAAWSPALATVNDRAAPEHRAVALALVLMIVGQLAFIGLPFLVGALSLKVAGADGWTLNGGFWGHLAIGHQTSGGGSTSTSWRYLLPIQVDASLGDADGAVHTMRTACILMTIALTVPIILYRIAGRYPLPDVEPDAIATTCYCPSCGAGNKPQDRYCQACGARVMAAAAKPSGLFANPLLPMLVGLGVGALVAILAMTADAEGLFHKKWSAAIVWKGAPQAVDDAIKNCKDAPCMFDALKANHAPAETLEFLKMLQDEAPSDELGYPTNFYGKGGVKVVELFIPGLGMAGVTDFAFINGTRAAVRPTDNIEAAATANPDYQNFRLQYPQVTPWDSLVFKKEVIQADGSQQFQFEQTLLNGCHACAVLGLLDIGYNFDKRGHYTGMTIVGVEADKKAPFAALLDRLGQESAFNQTFTQVQPDGRVATAPQQTELQPPNAWNGTQANDRCRLALVSNSQTFSGSSYLLDNAFDLKNVIIQTAAAAAAATAAAAGSVPPSSPGLLNTPAPPPAPPAPTNTIVISCRTGSSCISQDFSDSRGRASPLPSVSFLVPAENVDAVIRDFEALQAMCLG
jgi:hypothetical protein